MSSIQVHIVGTRGIPANYGGFETLADQLTAQYPAGISYTVFCSARAYENKVATYNGARLRYLPFDANGIQSIFYDNLGLLLSIRKADVILILGTSGCLFLPFWRILTKKPLLIHIDGLEWRREKWNFLAKWLHRFSERKAVKYATEIIADNYEIQHYLKETYNRSSVYIPYGGDHIEREVRDSALAAIYPFTESEYAVKICRIEPENNVHLVLKAFSEGELAMQLVIVGNWRHSKYGMDLLERFGKVKNIHLLDPIYDQKHVDYLRSKAKIYIHGHSAGGTNPSLVEAMHHKLPVFTFDVSFNRYTTDNKAYYFRDEKDLINLIRTADDTSLDKVSTDLYEFAMDRYLWSKISSAYVDLFNTVSRH